MNISQKYPIFQHVTKPHEIFLIFLVVINSILWSGLYVLRYHTFGLHTDTGSYEQTIWNTLNGNFFESSLTSTVFHFNIIRSDPLFELPTEILPSIFSTGHTNVIAAIFSPVYYLFPYTETLLISSMVLLSVAAIPLYLIAKKELKNKTLALIIASSYFLNPGLHAASLADFNFLTFAIPLLFFAFYFLTTSRWIPYWISIILLLTVREELGLVVFFFGLYSIFFQKKILNGITTSLIGIFTFMFIIFYIFPEFVNLNLAAGNFSITGQGLGFKGIFITLISNPQIISDHILSSNAWLYILQIFAHTGFLSLLNPAAFLMSFPELMKNLLATNDIPFRIFWNHYQLLIIPGLFLSTIFSVKTILRFFKKNQKYVLIIISIILISSALISNSLSSVAPLKSLDITVTKEGEILEKQRHVWWEFLNYSCCFDYSSNFLTKTYSDQINSATKAFSLIPEQASISTQDEFVSHLSQRSELYLFPILYDKVDYVLVMSETQGIFSTGFFPQEQQEKYVTKLHNDKNHELIFDENGLLLFKRIE